MAEKESPVAAWLSFAAAVVSAAFGLYATVKSKDIEAQISGLQRQLEEKKHDLERYKFVESLTERLAKDSEKASSREALISLALAKFTLDDKEYNQLLNALNATGDEKLQNITNTAGQASERAQLLAQVRPESPPQPAAAKTAAPPDSDDTSADATMTYLNNLIGFDRETRILAYGKLTAIPRAQTGQSVLLFLQKLQDQLKPPPVAASVISNAGLNNLLLYLQTGLPCWENSKEIAQEMLKLKASIPDEIIRHLALEGFAKIKAFAPLPAGNPKNNACN